jgi:hypothetical protein
MNKEKILFWLNRRVRNLENLCEEPDMEKMATQGLDYSTRQARLKDHQEKHEQFQPEIDAMREAIRIVEQHG